MLSLMLLTKLLLNEPDLSKIGDMEIIGVRFPTLLLFNLLELICDSELDLFFISLLKVVNDLNLLSLSLR